MRSLFARLLLLSLIVGSCSIGVATWLATRSVNQRASDQQQRTLETDNEIYRKVLAYGQGRTSWHGVDKIVRQLADSTGRRIALSSLARGTIADSLIERSASVLLPENTAALIDPLEPLVGMMSGSSSDPSIGVLPPLARKYSAAERATQYEQERLVAMCRHGYADYVGAGSEDRRARRSADTLSIDDYLAKFCGVPNEVPSSREVVVTNKITAENVACLESRGVSDAGVVTDPFGREFVSFAGDQPEASILASCRRASRQAALQRYVAPQALLYIAATERKKPGVFEAAGGRRTGLALLLVLAVAVVVTALLGRWLMRPIRALTDASERMATGDRAVRVAAHGRDDIARLGVAFNAMAEAVAATELQRQAMMNDIAHELRTPLSTIRGYLEAAQDGVLALDQDFVDSLLEDSTMLEHLIDDLSDLALADAGRLVLHREPHDLAANARLLVAAHNPAALAAGVTLELLAPTDVIVDCDPRRIRQALGNLVTNALRHTPSGGSVTVAIGSGIRDRGEIVIDVVDTGTGIDARDLPYVFDRFYRADVSRSRETGGSGLGLAITRNLIEAHGGTIAMRSKVGVGTTVRIRIKGPQPLSTFSRVAREVGSQELLRRWPKRNAHSLR